MDLTTSYLGLRLPHPLMPGASPLVDDLDTVRKLEDAGAAALVMRSLFEEQLVMEQMAAVRDVDSHAEGFAEAASYFPTLDRFKLGPEEYLEQIRKVKQAVGIPLIASLNGASPGGWLDFATKMHQAGADALELNVYFLATDPDASGPELEQQTIDMLRAVKAAVPIPVAVKLSPYYTALAHFAKQLDEAGADGLVLFNRFYQPDINIEELEVEHKLELSVPNHLLIRLRWLAILSGHINASLAVSGGIHTGIDALKAVMAGANAVQMVSALFKHGIEHIDEVRQQMVEWLEEHEYDSLEQARGSMNLLKCPDPKAFERGNYMEILQSWTR